MVSWPEYREAHGALRTALDRARIAWRVTHRRALMRWYDARARRAGYCNHSPYSPIPGEGGGYAHWRCALRRGHTSLHRGRNYVWGDDGRTEYRPVPPRERPSQPWERPTVLSRQQERERDRWDAAQRARLLTQGRRA
ncbi:hypothetical protein JNW90_10630 [Micromonospora sp. STR1s_5]|nr:hypothetical protein [Micromonospora sp. STR1s_5]